jgi:hypothetical protein
VTDEQHEAIRDRRQLATYDGEWFVMGNTVTLGRTPDGKTLFVAFPGHMRRAEAIARLPMDIDALLEENERLRAELDNLKILIPTGEERQAE